MVFHGQNYVSDINECERETDDCDEGEVCVNLEFAPGFECVGECTVHLYCTVVHILQIICISKKLSNTKRVVTTLKINTCSEQIEQLLLPVWKSLLPSF